MVVVQLGLGPEFLTSFEDYIPNNASVLLATSMTSSIREV